LWTAPSLDEVNRYLYSEGDDFHFMNTKKYEQMQMSRRAGRIRLLSDSKHHRESGIFFEEKAIGVDLPDTTDMKVIRPSQLCKRPLQRGS